MPFTIIRQDITKVQADAIVNTANPEPLYGEGTDYAIYQAAGKDQLLVERRKIGRIAPGEAAVTPALALHAKYIIHTVGPVWQGGDAGEMETLASCYRKALYLAETLRCESIAFPLISAGTYGFPKEQALQVAMDAIRDFCRESEMDVILAVFNKDAFRLSSEILDDVKQYVEDHYVEEKWGEEHPISYGSMAPSYNMPDEAPRARRRKLFERKEKKSEKEEGRPDESIMSDAGILFSVESGLPDLDEHLDISVGESFQESVTVLETAEESAAADLQTIVDHYCGLPQKDWMQYSPLTLAWIGDTVFDLIVRYCIEHQIYDIMEINAILFEYEQPLLA